MWLSLKLTDMQAGGIYRTTYGPAWFESLGVFPDSSPIVVTVNLGNDTIEIARDQLAAHIANIGWDRIRALEREYCIVSFLRPASTHMTSSSVGNEADHYAGGLRPSTWGSSDYTAQYLGWTTFLSRNLTLPKKIFQAAGFADFWSVKEVLGEGIADTGTVKVF